MKYYDHKQFADHRSITCDIVPFELTKCIEAAENYDPTIDL